ncbi:MAG TPA: purine-nucleoside phosphorylase [bacterium]|nr:purine-nucleoside phosphorylase [bacterium]
MLKQQIAQSVQAIRTKTGFRPELGIILGTGIGKLAQEVKSEAVVPYEDIPFFPVPTVESHRGRLIFGSLNGRAVVVMQGRFHYYEGYDAQQITHPVRVMKELGINTLIVSNASGGVNPQLRAGEVAVITDHINLTGVNPLRGPNDDSLGPRFPHMTDCYDPTLVNLAVDVALTLGIRLHPAVYAWVTGPNLETAAEYRYIRAVGADVVGMSTVPEVIVARHAGLRVLGFSVITDMGLPDAMRPVELSHVLAMAAKAEPNLTAIVREVVRLA